MREKVMWLSFVLYKLRRAALVKIWGCSCFKVGILKSLLIVARKFLSAGGSNLNEVTILKVV